MRNLQQDLRFGIRQMAKAPGFAVATVLTIALGIGATTSIFSLVNAVLLRPLPFPDPDRLVAAGSVDERHPEPANSLSAMSYPDFFDWRAQSHSFSGVATYRDNTFTLTGSRRAATPGRRGSHCRFFQNTWCAADAGSRHRSR